VISGPARILAAGRVARAQGAAEVAEPDPPTDEAPTPPRRRHGRIREEEPNARSSTPWLQGWRSIVSAVVVSAVLAGLALSDIPVERIDAVAPWIVAALALAVGGKDLPGAVAALRTLAEARVIGAARAPRE